LTQSDSQDRYRELFDRSADAILIIDGETFVDCNQATVEMLRYRNKAELLQTHPSELSPEFQPDGRASFEKANEMIAIAFGEGSHRFEWNHRRADGEIFPVEVLLTAVPKDDRKILHVVWRDITDRKRLESDLRQAQRMEAVGKLAGGIAHDFNNLLLVIGGHTEHLQAKLQGQNELIEHLSEIAAASDRAASLVAQLLAFSRKQILQPTVIDLNSILTDLERMLARLLGEDIEIETRLSDDALYVHADPGQLEQVIINLATNARDAMPRGGRLIFETRRMTITEGEAKGGLEPGLYARLTTIDEGIGMDATTLERIFEPFFTTKDQGKGTGLGLSTVYGIVKQSRGDIVVISEPGKGTSIRVLMPLTSERRANGDHGASDLEREDRSSAPAEGTIFVVEDEPAVGALVESVLKTEGYTVLRARNGAEALQLIETADPPFDLLLTDVVMPRMGGPELVRKLQESHPGLKVLYISGYTDSALMERGALEEGIDLLQKPFTPRDLKARVRGLLRGD
jgi:PAS domain S-box-containing protein